MPLLFTIILTMIYIGVGMLLAAPYVFLSGWNIATFTYAALCLPIVVIILIILYITSHKDFWTTVTFICLPIVLNGISVIFKWLDYTKTAEMIFKWRFKSLVFILLATLAILVIKNLPHETDPQAEETITI